MAREPAARQVVLEYQARRSGRVDFIRGTAIRGEPMRVR